MTLFAYCKIDGGGAVKRIPITSPVQQRMRSIFLEQEVEFRAGRTSEVAFDGDWAPDDDELLTLEVPPEVANVVRASTGNALSLPTIDVSNFEAENIRALFIVEEASGKSRLLVQRFTSMQELNRKRALLLHNNSFRELSEPAFTIGVSLCCVIEDDLIKFDSFSNLRSIFNLTTPYQQATDADIDEIARHSSIDIQDLPTFKSEASQTLRKLVHKVLASGVLDAHSPQDIKRKAAAAGLNLQLRGGVLQVPADKTLARHLFRFLDDGLYEAALSRKRYVTNSKKAI